MQPAVAAASTLFRSSVLGFALVAGALASQLIAQEKPAAPAGDQSSAPLTEPGSAAELNGASADKHASGSEFGTARLGVGDLLAVNVFNIPELSSKARVGNTGDIYLPLINYVHVADLTLEEAQTLIEKRLADGGFVNNPHVTLFIDEYASQAVSILGEVKNPGPYPVLGARRLYDLISAAGGLTDKAGRTVTISHRYKPDAPSTISLAEGLAQTASSNVAIQPGDTVVVQRAGIIYVVGDVGRPSGFLMDNDNLTVLQAVALAGGTNRTAKLNSAKILRKTSQGIQETAIPLKRILQAKAPDVPMRADDILFVPSSAGKTAAYHGAQAAVQAAVGLSIIAARP